MLTFAPSQADRVMVSPGSVSLSSLAAGEDWAFDDLMVVVADELDGAGGISLGNSVHNVHPSPMQRSRDASPVLGASRGWPRRVRPHRIA
jgi:hypothetical protein